MESLWIRLSERNNLTHKPYFAFLLVHTLLWLVPLGVAAALICHFLSMPTVEVIRWTGLIAGYPGVVVGFFGGLLYLMRNQ